MKVKKRKKKRKIKCGKPHLHKRENFTLKIKFFTEIYVEAFSEKVLSEKLRKHVLQACTYLLHSSIVIKDFWLRKTLVIKFF